MIDSFITTLKNIRLFRFLHSISFLRTFYYWIMSFLAAVFYGFPSRDLTVIGVTGTKGKTSVVETLGFVFQRAGYPTATLSSLQSSICGVTTKNRTGNTMPGRFAVQQFLHRARKARCRFVFIEVTSQGAAMFRDRFIHWSAAALTNLSPEHIEWHGSFEKYRDAKYGFLKRTGKNGGVIFLNGQDQHFSFFSEKLKQERIKNIVVSTIQGINSFVKDNFYFSGDFAQQNAAIVICLAKFFNISDAHIADALRCFSGVAGRFEFIQKEPFGVVVDYAHTPDSLQALYSTLKNNVKLESQSSRLICVLGSAGGGRDAWKRSKMGEIAGNFCDVVYLTDEDPYDEDPMSIISAIHSGISTNIPVHEIIDRREAITQAITSARPHDVVVLTGKGSEASIHISSGRTITWSEREVVQDVLRSL